jgi:hypothetical protein
MRPSSVASFASPQGSRSFPQKKPETHNVIPFCSTGVGSYGVDQAGAAGSRQWNDGARLREPLGESASGSGPPASNDPAISNLDPVVAGWPHRITAIPVAVNHDVERDRPSMTGPLRGFGPNSMQTLTSS